MSLDPTDQKLLDLLQEGLPLISRPFALLGEKLGLSEKEVLERLKDLQEKGILRHLGASPDSRRLGFVTTLCALSAPAKERERIAHEIASFPQVTHCYLRRHQMNVWFTLVAKDFDEVERILRIIEEKTGFRARHFPATKMFKLRATFRLSGAEGKDS